MPISNVTYMLSCLVLFVCLFVYSLTWYDVISDTVVTWIRQCMRRPLGRGEDVAGEIAENDSFQWEKRNYTLILIRLELPTPGSGCPGNLYYGIFLANNRTVSGAHPLWDYFHLAADRHFCVTHACNRYIARPVKFHTRKRYAHNARKQIPSQTNKHFVRALLFQRRMLRRKLKQKKQNWTNLAWLYEKPTFTFIRLLKPFNKPG